MLLFCVEFLTSQGLRHNPSLFLRQSDILKKLGLFPFTSWGLFEPRTIRPFSSMPATLESYLDASRSNPPSATLRIVLIPQRGGSRGTPYFVEFGAPMPRAFFPVQPNCSPCAANIQSRRPGKRNRFPRSFFFREIPGPGHLLDSAPLFSHES